MRNAVTENIDQWAYSMIVTTIMILKLVCTQPRLLVLEVLKWNFK